MYEETIREVMLDCEVDPRVVPEEPEVVVDPSKPRKLSRSKRYFATRAFALFEAHESCKRHWGSAHSWSILDLKEQEFCHFYGQDCRNCEEAVTPEYDTEAVERMVRWACKVYKIRKGIIEPESGDEDDSDEEENGKGPHDQKRCGMCNVLGHACWTRGRKTPVEN